MPNAMFHVSTSRSIAIVAVVEVVLVHQHLVVEEPHGERIRLPVPRAEVARSAGRARGTSSAGCRGSATESRASRSQPSSTITHRSRVGGEHREPAVVVGDRGRRRRVEVAKPGARAELVEEHAVGRNLRPPVVHVLRDPLPHERRRTERRSRPSGRRTRPSRDRRCWVEDGDVLRSRCRSAASSASPGPTSSGSRRA